MRADSACLIRTIHTPNALLREGHFFVLPRHAFEEKNNFKELIQKTYKMEMKYDDE